MRKIMMGFLAAGAILFGTSSVASACPIKGKVVCTGTNTPAEGVEVTFTPVAGYAYDFCQPGPSDATDASGIYGFDENGFPNMHLCGGTYTVNLDPTFLLTCDLSNQDGIDLTSTPFQANGPKCAPAPADCSPGYYKNHPEAWCYQCFPNQPALCRQASNGTWTGQLLTDLAARGPGSEVIRDAAKAQIDACFGTAAASPCVDDNG